jgi:hypothetical protein
MATALPGTGKNAGHSIWQVRSWRGLGFLYFSKTTALWAATNIGIFGDVIADATPTKLPLIGLAHRCVAHRNHLTNCK